MDHAFRSAVEHSFRLVLCAVVVVGGCRVVWWKKKDLAQLEWRVLLWSPPDVPPKELRSARRWDASAILSYLPSKAVVTINKPMLLSKMEAVSDAVITTTARASRLRSLTGIKDVGRLTEVMEQTIIPLMIRELSPKGVLSSGLVSNFDLHLRESLLEQDGGAAVLLSEFTGRHTFRAVVGALFGPTFPSSTFEDYMVVSRSVEKPEGTFPRWFPSDRGVIRARRRLMDAVSQYLEEWWYADGLHTIPNLSPLGERLLHGAKDEELDLEEASGALLSLLYDAHFNLWSTTFWLMSQALSDTATQQTIVSEVRAQPAPSFCPLLESATEEALRWAPLPRPVRELSEDGVIRVAGVQHPLKSGTRLILDLHTFHFDADVYTHPELFDAARFLDRALPLARPFGEGKSKCKGAYLAKLQIKSFVYHTLLAVDFEVRPSKPATDGSMLWIRSRLQDSEEDIYVAVSPVRCR